MKIQVLAFGYTEEILGARINEITLEEKSTVQHLTQYLYDKYPIFDTMAAFRIAVNQKMENAECLLKSGDEIALIPPVSGG